eukprot:CAMPEP_0172601904 /NCGR_PEP_ID=MMETSP1068-20121228/22072_1 /TAXON_ID=35684 /ORGANISM="Pseudopedinella elastica, Strain CCMP716" /LENGTH=269 /DNA_ID=CAMNT_0013403075 /DNA_START=301 /DNA_END=1110 /DNA_ORIENTATION=-
MTNVSCKFLFLAGLSMVGDEDVAIEFGSWVGHSSSCLAAGLLSGGAKGRLHCYDMFKWTGESDLKGTHWSEWSAEDGRRMGIPTLLPIFVSIVHRVDPFVTPHIGNMAEKVISSPESWGDKNVGIFAIDSAKQWNQLIEQTQHGIWSKIAVGGLVLMMDFAKHASQICSFYTVFIREGYLRNEYVAFTASPWAFSVNKPLALAQLRTYEAILKSPERYYILSEARRQVLIDIKTASSVQRASSALTLETTTLVLRHVDACIKNVQSCAS